MKIAELLFYVVAGWCVLGVLGTFLSLGRGRRAEALKHAGWVAAVAGIYLLALFAVSLFQRQRIVAIGQDQCFGSMCFRVMGFDEVPAVIAGASGRVVRVRMAVVNHGRTAAEQPTIEAYLLDSQGRRWFALPGVSGNRITTRISAGSEIVSQPLFHVAADATGLGLVFTHGSWQPHQLILGDSDSLAHRPTVVALGR